MSKGYENKTLGSWVSTQRKNYKEEKLSDEKIKLLSKIGFQLDVLETNWQKNYIRLVIYKDKHGHCNVPRGYEYKTLGIWVSKQRKDYRQGKLRDERIKLLNELDFQWPIKFNKMHKK